MRVQTKHQADRVIVTSAHLELRIDLATGLWSASWNGLGQVISAGCGAKLMDGTSLSSDLYPQHVCSQSDISSISDEFGHGVRVTVHHNRAGSPDIEQIFRVYDDQPYFLVGIKLVDPKGVATNSITPVSVDETRTRGAGVVLGTQDKPRSLFVPYDNDAFVRYNSDYAGQSYEVTAIYDNRSRRGFVFGSVTHDLWKTGLTIGGWDSGRAGSVSVYGGAADKNTRDTQPHGVLTGQSVASPQVFIGCFADWREGLEGYGHANARVSPPLSWENGPPFGWNSWYAYMTQITAERFLAASSFLKDTLQPRGFHGKGAVYVNLDSFWDAISESDLIDAVKQIHARGQKTGIYWTPFTFWGNENDLARTVPGAESYTYRQACLKDAAGQPLPKLDGGFPMDPTHPATLANIDWQLARFVKWGFDFVKLDFMTHGALEGAHFDPAVTTGTAAYKLGMERIAADLSPSRIGRSFFISLSIAPLFPAGYGHSRRISCDIYPGIGPTEYLLNSLTYGWWIGGSLYSYNDPDMMILYQVHGGQQPTTEQEARTRVNSAAIAGGMLLNGDDLTNPAAQQRAESYLTNVRINALARMGWSFRPVEGDTGSHASDTFVYEDSRHHRLYVGVFNYDSAKAATKQVKLTRLGLSGDKTYPASDLWTGRAWPIQGVLSVDLPPAGSTIVSIETN